MKKFIFFTFTVGALIAASIYVRTRPKDIPKPPNYERAVITMVRSVCYGTCPSYKLSIMENGEIIYEGYRFVEVKGIQTSQVSPDQVKELVGEFYKIDFFNLKDEYTGGVTDLPTINVTLSVGGRTKKVIDYWGAPESLRNLERKIDEVTNSQKWIGDCRKTGTCN